jgi:hypothetical protein
MRNNIRENTLPRRLEINACKSEREAYRFTYPLHGGNEVGGHDVFREGPGVDRKNILRLEETARASETSGDGGLRFIQTTCPIVAGAVNDMSEYTRTRVRILFHSDGDLAAIQRAQYTSRTPF